MSLLAGLICEHKHVFGGEAGHDLLSLMRPLCLEVFRVYVGIEDELWWVPRRMSSTADIMNAGEEEEEC